MTTTSVMNQSQRLAYENTLREKLRQAQNALDTKRDAAEADALQKVLEVHGALELVDGIKACRDEIETSEKELEAKGFELGYQGVVRIAHDTPEELKNEYGAIMTEQTKVEQSKVDAIREALTNSWQVANVEQAKAIVAVLV